LTNSKKKKKTWSVEAAVFSALRRKFKTYPPYKETRDAAKVEYFVKSKHGKDMRRVHFQCAHCQQYFKDKDIAVDHIDPVNEPEVGFVDFDTYVQRLFCPLENLQILCKSCHKKKSAEETKTRAKARRSKKDDNL